MSAVLKEKPQEPQTIDKDLSRLPHGELLRIIGPELRSPRAKAALDLLLKAHAECQSRRESFKPVRELGVHGLRRNAIELRTAWREHLVQSIVKNTLEGRLLSRPELIGLVRGYTIGMQQTGKMNSKGDNRIKRSTVTRWLTIELEYEIRNEAAERFRSLITTVCESRTS